MASAFACRGCRVESYELERDPCENVLSPAVTAYLHRIISIGKPVVIWAGIPCASWTRARRGPADYSGMPPPLRGDTLPHIWGLPDLRPKDVERVRIGNRQVRWMAALLRCARDLPVLILVEIRCARDCGLLLLLNGACIGPLWISTLTPVSTERNG